jgi:hypothetical protein
MKNEATDQLENYPHSDPKFSAIGGGHNAPYYEISALHMKELVASAVTGDGIRWRQPTDGNTLYGEHLAAEEKREVRPAFGNGSR